MTNRYAGYAHQLRRGYWAMIRLAKDSHPKPIMGEGGAPVVFETEIEALKAVNKHLLQYLNFPIVGGEVESGSSVARAKAERLFIGGGRVVEVERMEAAR